MKIKYENKISKTCLKNDGLEALILDSGNLFELNKGIIRINSLSGNNLEPTAQNIYLRVQENELVSYQRLIGVGSNSLFKIIDNNVYYEGIFKGVKYEVIFSVLKDNFYYTVNLKVPDNVSCQVYYGMDVAVSDLYAVRNNEAYVSQYLNHSIYHDDLGYTVMTRQNQGINHYLEQGSFSKNIGFETDGFKFFGNEFKLDNYPAAIKNGKLSNEVYQYEFAYIALASEVISGCDETLVFYGAYLDELKEVREKPLLKEEAYKLYQTLNFNKPQELNKPRSLKLSFKDTYPYVPFSEEEIKSIFPNRHLEEKIDGNLASFFSERYSYVTVCFKEKYLERQTGAILLSTKDLNFEETLASTVYAGGIFNSQVVCGNTSFNKLDANSRNALNLSKIKGQRIFIKVNGKFELLGMPSLFELGLNYAKWYYKINGDFITVETVIDNLKPLIVTKVKAHNKYEFLVTDYLTLSQNEYECPYSYEVNDRKITYYFDETSMAFNRYPDFVFKKQFDVSFTYHHDEVFYDDNEGQKESLEVIKLEAEEFSYVIIGDTFNKGYDFKHDDLNLMKNRYESFIDELLCHFHIRNVKAYQEEMASLDIISRYYTQNMLVHLTSPHGLEQYNGAAWGTRDVCQGPAEFLLATNNFPYLKKIITMVYEHQYFEDGDWPQWFMFDRFSNIQDLTSHGDVILWPLRLVGLYLEKTLDYELLNLEIPYTLRDGIRYSEFKETLLEHILKATKKIKKNYLKDTSLSRYGGGDWDDTLQPANKELSKNLVSGWTVALTYEVFMKLSKVFKNYDLNLSNMYLALSNDISKDYHKYLIKDEVPAGFVYFNPDGSLKYIIHPDDLETGLKYRLLPINRGIVSELFTEKEKDIALALIANHLKFNDGVRLMDKTIPYHGGINTYFMRAETASNFGREIGLQYCHAHIRYCEALAKAGLKDELFKSLITINPITLDKVVKNAMPRQRNCYFSSSDGNFLNRYEAMKDFNKLKNGEVKVKSGWRVYSSGPGIYLNQIISNFLGLRVEGKNLIIDPTVSHNLDGLEVSYQILCYNLHIKYVLDLDCKIMINGNALEADTLVSKYRNTGLVIPFESLEEESIILVRIGD